MTTDHSKKPSADLARRLANAEIILLDGAVGTQLQIMGVPMDNTSWAAKALHTHPDTIRQMHHKYLQCGVDVITTNSYSSARHNLEPIGLGDQTKELNRLAVNLAKEACEQYSTEAAAIAGSISNFGIVTDEDDTESLHRRAQPRARIKESQAKYNLREQAEILVEAGADLLLVESTGSMRQRRWCFEACLDLDVPVWLGYRARIDEKDSTVRAGYSSTETLEDGLKQLLDVAQPEAIAIFHSIPAAVSAALPIVKQHWSGSIAVYPEADRTDYTAEQRDESVKTQITPAEFVAETQNWIQQGAQIVGGCCGIDVEYIHALGSGLEDRVGNY